MDWAFMASWFAFASAVLGRIVTKSVCSLFYSRTLLRMKVLVFATLLMFFSACSTWTIDADFAYSPVPECMCYVYGKAPHVEMSASFSARFKAKCVHPNYLEVAATLAHWNHIQDSLHNAYFERLSYPEERRVQAEIDRVQVVLDSLNMQWIRSKIRVHISGSNDPLVPVHVKKKVSAYGEKKRLGKLVDVNDTLVRSFID